MPFSRPAPAEAKDELLRALLRLARPADVLAYNVRPQAMARLRLTYDDVRAVNPRIIYVGAYGYGEGGPYAGEPGRRLRRRADRARIPTARPPPARSMGR